MEELNEVEESQDNLDDETIRYLNQVETELYNLANTKSQIDSGLLFIASQVSSVSMTWVLFSCQVATIPCCIIAASIALMPGLITLSDTFGLAIDSEKWEVLGLNQKPLASLVKLGLGALTTYCGSTKILALEANDKQQITVANQQIQQIHKGNYPFSVPFDLGAIVILLFGVGALVVKLKFFTKTEETNDV